ncbi:MAG: SDR family oxidoreductase [Bacteroidetes bacterium]|nr:MAG: SDR family oxidoreductase [Bacteroidota bacterium]
MKSFTDKTAVVVGAGHGLGRALARELAREGCHLALLDRDGEGLRSLQEELQAFGRRCSLHEVDIGRREEVLEAARAVAALHSQVHLLFNCAAVSFTGLFLEHSLEDFEWVTGVDYLGTVYCCHAFLPLLLRQPEAWVVNVSSGAALQGLPRRSAYCGAKFAVRGFSEALRLELLDSGVRVCCVFPGPLRTEMYTRSRHARPEFRERERRYLERRGWPPEKAARALLRGVRQRRAEIFLGRAVFLGARIRGCFPGLFRVLLERFRHRLPV